MAKPKLTVARIQSEIRSSGLTWTAGQTPLSALPEAEQEIRLGLEVPTGERERIQMALARSAPMTAAYAFAPERDWRSNGGKNYITPIRDQGQCGSCVAFGSVATIEAQARIEFKRPDWDVNLSEADLFFCGAGKRCEQGWWPPEALKYAAAKGIADDSLFPYQDHNMDCKNMPDKPNKLLKVGQWQEVVSVAQRKGWLDTSGPMVGCIAVYRDFFSYTSGVYKHATGDLAGYHCISVVGYSEAEKAWICKNSWGTGWGDKGFFKIGYGECEIDTNFAMYGVSGITGTLAPTDDEDTGIEFADHVVVQDGTSDGSFVLFAYVQGKWRHMQVPPARAAVLGATVLAASKLEVKFTGEDITGVAAWKQY